MIDSTVSRTTASSSNRMTNEGLLKAQPNTNQPL